MDGLDDKGGEGIAAGWFDSCLSATVGDCKGEFTPNPGVPELVVEAAAKAMGSFPMKGGNNGVVAMCVDSSSSSLCLSN